jgi:AraC family transcriptional regulator
MNDDYSKRFNTILQYIDDHLDGDLTLEVVSKIAFYSPFHFHRIFKMITNETLNKYVTRKRIEKTAGILLHQKSVTITAIYLQYGFNSNSSFTKTFKKFYGVSPTEFRKSAPSKYSKIRQVESKNGQEHGLFETYICNITNHLNWITMQAKIEIKEMPELKLAYITQIGAKGLASAYEKLIKWATPKSLLEYDKLKMVTIYHDSFKITNPDKVRMSACITIAEKFAIDGEIGFRTIAKGRYIVGSFEIGIAEFEKSWTALFIWMNEKGYKKADSDPFEIYHNNFNEHPQKKCIVDFCIPIT